MAATTQDLQRLLDDAWDSAPETASTLRDELRRYETAVGALLSGGSIQSVGKNSANQSYAYTGNGTLTTAEVARAWRDLISLFDRCQQVLITAGTESPTDDEIYAEMKARLRPVYQTRGDYRNLRCAA